MAGAANAPEAVRVTATLVIRAYCLLAAILDDAVSDRRAMSNPPRGISLPRKIRKPHRYLSREQVHALAGASKYPAHSSAAMTLDVYADLFDGDLDAVSDAVDHAISLCECGQNVGNRLISATQKAPVPL